MAGGNRRTYPARLGFGHLQHRLQVPYAARWSIDLSGEALDLLRRKFTWNARDLFIA